MSYLSATEAVKKLNATVPKELMPSTGVISRQYFHKKKKEGRFNTYQDNEKDAFLWEEVAPAFGLKIESDKIKKKRLKVSDSDFQDLLDELELLELEAVTPNQKVEVAKKFWEAQTKKIEYKEKIGELIPMEKIITTLSTVMPVLKDKMYKIPPTIKTSFPDTPVEVIEDIHDMISLAFEELQLHEFQ